MTRDGEIFLNKKPIALQDLGQLVRAALATKPELMVILNADGEVHHSVVVDVIDELRSADVSHLAIAVKPDRKAQP
jgi:biopolymer transport protein ExbD